MANLSQPIAEYAIRVRDANLNLVGELSHFQSAGFTLRYNNVSAWMVQIDANDPLADDLAADGAGIQVLRVLRDPATGARLSGGVLFSGPRWGRVRQMQGRTLIASGYDDLWLLEGATAYPVTTLPYSAVILADGPKRYYRLGESSGATATDSSTSAQNGTYNGGVTYSAAPGIDDTNKAVTLNGSTGYISSPVTGLPTGNPNLSIECWVKIAANPSGNVILGGYGTRVAHERFAIFLNASGQAAADTFSGATSASSALSLNTWHHIVGTWDGTNLLCYVDGVQTASATPGAMTIPASPAGVSFGADIGGTAGTFVSGSIDECALYNACLTPAQISNHYAVGISRFANAKSDDRVGAAETIIRQYVDANAVSASNDPLGQSRVIPHLTLAADSGRGSTVNGTARFDQLIWPDGTGLLQQLAQSGGMGFQVVQSGSSLVFQQYITSDKSASVIFSERMGNLADFSYQEDGPDYSQGGNVAIVGGGGAGTARVIVTRADTASIARWGRHEFFVDARDTTDVPTLQQRGDAALAQSAVQTQFACTLAPQRAVVYGADFNVGDTVTVVIDGVSFANIVREVAITLDASGAETVTPAVGTPNADTIRQLFGGFVQERQLASLRSTANKLARSQ